MECSRARELLSPYCDDEIPADMHSSVAKHVNGCWKCDDEVSAFRQLSSLAAELDDPEPPNSIWANIALELYPKTRNPGADARSGRSRGFLQRWRVSLPATAALLMVAAGIAWIASRTWHDLGHDRQFATDFGEYLDHFPKSPDDAQQILLARYEGQAVSLSQATRHLGYRPAVATEPPKRYSLDGLYVLEMPCCRCVQSIYRRDDGGICAIFEHDEKQAVWFGNRPRISAQVDGHPCDVVQFQDRLAASWKEGNRYLTIVGAQDLDEMMLLMTHFHAGASQG